LIYYTEFAPLKNENCFVEKNMHKRELQKKIISDKNSFKPYSAKKNYRSFKKK
jgi:hypothetical protein